MSWIVTYTVVIGSSVFGVLVIVGAANAEDEPRGPHRSRIESVWSIVAIHRWYFRIGARGVRHPNKVEDTSRW
jgi:hypothetical protein